MVQCFVSLRRWRTFCERDSLVNFTVETCRQLFLPLFRPEIIRLQSSLHRGNWITRLPILDFRGVAIFGSVDLRVAVPSVGLALKKRGTAAGAGPVDCIAH